MVAQPVDKPRKGRGALSNQGSRYEPEQRVAFDDGWDRDEDEEAPAPATTVLPDSSRSVIARNDSPDIPFDRSINPYRGCEHGCIYCYARPSHAWLGLSPGLDFETRIFAKLDAAARLRTELNRPSYRPALIALGANTDPYQPSERRLGITRQVLEVLAEAKHPLGIVTKSHLILRDLDILVPMAAEGLVRVCVSVTTLNRGLARRMEPRAPSALRRLEAIRGLAAAGIPTGALAAPMIPALNDEELESILEAAAAAGAGSAGYVLLRLPLEIKDLFSEWLEAHWPDRKKRILGLVRETRAGKLYDPAFGRRQTGQGVYADLLRRRFELACRRVGLHRDRWAPDTAAFRRPAADPRQLALF